MLTFQVETSKVKISPVRSEITLVLSCYDSMTQKEEKVFWCTGEMAEFIEGERVRIHAQKGKNHSPESNSEEFTTLCYGLMLSYHLGQKNANPSLQTVPE